MPQRQRVGENNVSGDIPQIVVGEIDRGIELEVVRHVAGKSCGEKILGPTLKIELGAPSLVEVISNPEDRLHSVINGDCSDDELGMFKIVTGFDEGLGNLAARRPIDKSYREQVWLFLNQAYFSRENCLPGIKPLEDRNLELFGHPQFELELIRIPDLYAGDLGAQGQVGFFLKIRRHDLTQSLRGREGGGGRKRA